MKKTGRALVYKGVQITLCVVLLASLGVSVVSCVSRDEKNTSDSESLVVEQSEFDRIVIERDEYLGERDLLQQELDLLVMERDRYLRERNRYLGERDLLQRELDLLESGGAGRWETWEKEDDFSYLRISEKPEVAEGIDIVFIDAGQTVTLSDGRTASLELYIEPGSHFVEDENGGILYKNYYYAVVFRLDDEVFPLNTQRTYFIVSAYVIYGVGAEQPRGATPFIFVIDNDGFQIHEIYSHSFDTVNNQYNPPSFNGTIKYIEPGYLTIGKYAGAVLGTHEATARYTSYNAFSRDRSPVDSMYDLSRSPPVTLMVDLDVYLITRDNEDCSLTKTTLRTGTAVTAVRANLIDLIIVEDEEGNEYVITGYLSPQPPYGQETINGIPVTEIFDGVQYAGAG